MNRYIRERGLPAVLTCAPLFTFFGKLVMLHLYSLLKSMPGFLNALTGIISASALLFFSTQLNRFIFKKLVKINYFNTEIEIPTTDYLLWKNDSSDKPIKEIIRSKIQVKLGVNFMDEMDELKNEASSKEQIAIAVSKIKSLLSDNELFIQHNTEYQFFLNLLAGCFTACLFSFALILLGDYDNYESIKTTGIIFLIVYILPVFFRKFLMQQLVNHYSKLFYKQFLDLEID